MEFKKSTLYLGLALGLSLAPLSANPEIWQKDIQDISQQVKADPDADADKERANQAQIDTSLRTIQMALAAEDYHQAITQLNNLRNLEPKAVKSILALSEKLIDTLVLKSKEDITRKEKLYEEFAKSIIAAEVASEIDPWLKKLNEEVRKSQNHHRSAGALQLWAPSAHSISQANSYSKFNGQSQLFNMNCSNLVHLQSKATTALQIAQSWQDYLHYKSQDNTSLARSSMTRVSQYVANFTYISRSKVLDLQSAFPDSNNARDEAGKIKINDLLKRLTNQQDALTLHYELKATSSSYFSAGVRELNNKLQSYSMACEYLEGGDLDDGFYKIRTLMSYPVLSELSKQTRDHYLNHYLAIPTEFKKKENEDSEVFVTRYLSELSQQKAWKNLRASLALMKQYYYRSSGVGLATVKGDLEALDYFIVARNYETHKQYKRAIVAYRQVLGKQASYTEVTEEAGKSLLRLQKTYPVESDLSESMSSHTATLSSYRRSNSLIRNVVKEELSKLEERKEDAQ